MSQNTYALSNLSFSMTDAAQSPAIIWAHGWGQSGQSFADLISPLRTLGKHIALDFPGFGKSSIPPQDWTLENYTDLCARFITEHNLAPVTWIGHSFGCRVGIRLAANYPDLVGKLCLIAGAGLQRKRPFTQQINVTSKIYLYKTLKHLIPYGPQQLGFTRERLLQLFASPDYANAGPLRQVFRNVIAEDLTAHAREITCPTLLIYGDQDTETPPEIGQRLEKLIPNAKMVLLQDEDHYSVLQTGRHKVTPLLKNFIKEGL